MASNLNLNTLIDKFAAYVDKHTNKTFMVALSGGLDSTVLLHICCELRNQYGMNLRAIHVNHGLHADANQWAKHCEDFCEKLNVPFTIQKIKIVTNTGDSVEEKARDQRYAAIMQMMTANDVLLTAHHLNDQCETFLIQLFRGAGVKGLAAMPKIKIFGRGVHLRPFLNIPRNLILQYANEKSLTWIEDEANLNRDYMRNFVRHDVIPLIEKRLPNIHKTIARSARHCAEADELLIKYGQALFLQTIGTAPHTLSITKIKTFSIAQQKLIIRYWIKNQNFNLPSAKKINNILQNVLEARQDRFPCVSWGNAEVRRYKDDLFILTTIDKMPQKKYVWNTTQVLVIPSVGTLKLKPEQDYSIQLEVSFRTGGERIRINKQHRSLKKMFQDWQIPPWLRPRIPLIYREGELIAVVGYWTSEINSLQFVLE